MDWGVVPWGLKHMCEYIQKEYEPEGPERPELPELRELPREFSGCARYNVKGGR